MEKPAPTGRKNTRPVHWNTDGVEVLLHYVNKHKGDRPKLAFDQSRALTDLRRKLSSAFTDDDFSRLRETSVRDKLTHIFRRCKKERFHAIKDFWVHGLDALDLQKVRTEYDGISLDFNGSDSDTETEVDELPPPKKIKRKRNEHGQEAKQTVTLKFKNPKTQSSDTDMAPSNVRYSREIDREIEADLLRSRDEDGMEIPESDDDVGYEDESDEGSSPQPGQAGNHVVRSPYFPTQLPAHAYQTPTSRIDQQTPVQTSEMATPRISLQVPADMAIITPQSVEKFIGSLRKKIHVAVCKYLAGQGFPEKQPVTLDLNLVFSREMKSMMARLAGTSTHDWDSTKSVMEKLFSSDNHKKLSLNAVVQGMVGAAIQLWCFEPFSGTRWWDRHAMETDVQILLRSSVRTEDFERFRLRAIRNYIQANFVPAAPRLANKQARLFDQQLVYLLPDRPASSLTTGADFVGPPINPQAADPAVLIKGPVLYEIPATPSDPRTEAAIDESRRPIITKETQEKWIEDLGEIFEDALLFRAHMELPYDEHTLSEVEWEFDFPRYQEKMAEGGTTSRVMVGMFAKIYAIEKKKRFLPQGGYAPLKSERVGVANARAQAADITE